MAMGYRLLAEGVVLLHAAFVVFAVAGGLLVLRWRRAAWLHLPAAAWAAGIEFGGCFCPLTTLENYLWDRGGASPYTGGFVEHYIVPVLYPEDLTRGLQVAIGAGVLAVNLGVYAWVLWRWRHDRTRTNTAPDGPGP